MSEVKTKLPIKTVAQRKLEEALEKRGVKTDTKKHDAKRKNKKAGPQGRSKSK